MQSGVPLFFILGRLGVIGRLGRLGLLGVIERLGLLYL